MTLARLPSFRQRPTRRLAGFTLIELLVVLAILGLLATAAHPVLALHQRRMQEADLRAALRTIRGALDAYQDAAREGRIARAVDEPGYPPSLEALTRGVTDMRSPIGQKIYFLRRLPRDPFASPEQPAASTWGVRSSDSPAEQPRPGRDVFDVHSLSEQRALDGSFYRDW